MAGSGCLASGPRGAGGEGGVATSDPGLPVEREMWNWKGRDSLIGVVNREGLG